MKHSKKDTIFIQISRHPSVANRTRHTLTYLTKRKIEGNSAHSGCTLISSCQDVLDFFVLDAGPIFEHLPRFYHISHDSLALLTRCKETSKQRFSSLMSYIKRIIYTARDSDSFGLNSTMIITFEFFADYFHLSFVVVPFLASIKLFYS